MCGIAGLVALGPGDRVSRPRHDRRHRLSRAGRLGRLERPASGVALGHRRLAIVDLTPTGAQPMVSADGRWVISYNGEVYNAEAIAADPQMAGLARRGTSIPK